MEEENVTSLQRRNGLGFYQASHLDASGRLIHAFTTRQGGVSPPPFHTLNLSISTGDKSAYVRKNRKILAGTFGLDPSTLLTVNQVHEADVLIVEGSASEDLSEASWDAIVTQRPGIAIGVLTADCVPILMFDPENVAVAAVHAGWKGTASDLLGKTIGTMVNRFRTRPERLRVGIGPSIGPCCYEVDDRVKSTFSCHNDSWPKWARAVSHDRWMLNLSRVNVDLLLESGIRPENMVRFDICTHCHPHLFYSHRRDGRRTGRQMAFIMLK